MKVWLWMLGAVSLAAALVHCSTSSAGADGGSDVPFIPLSCSSTDDCVSAGLDADTCVYSATPGNCASVGGCERINPSVHTADCTPAVTVCPCSSLQCECTDAGCVCPDNTTVIPACWQGFSPVPVATTGRCPADGGAAGH